MRARIAGIPIMLLVLAIVVLVTTGPSSAYFPITISGQRVHWDASDIPVTYVIQSAGSADIADDSESVAIRQAFLAWQSAASSSLTFTEDLTANAARTDWGADDIHLILFDETDSSGFFTGSSSVVAVTPVSFNPVNGEIIDADIIFNGDDHTFSTDAAGGTFDVQGVATHEIGHFLGLDHSGIGAATMYPFVANQLTVQRGLSADDVAGVTDLYPGAPTVGSISGSIVMGGAVPGAHVVAMNDEGIVVSGTYTAADGTYVLDYLPPDTYNVYVEPLDSPVTSSNLSSSISSSVATNFETQFLGGNVNPTDLVVNAGANLAVGSTTVSATGPFNITAYSESPALAARGAFASVTIFGTGLDGMDETLSVSGTGVSIFWSTFTNGSPPSYSLILQATVGASLGPINLTITDSSNQIAIATGVVQVVDPEPTITNLTPSVGSTAGGTSVTITGTNFVTGAVVHIGDALATGVTVDSATQITCTAPAGDSGSVDVIVQNPDGQLVESVDGFDYEGAPTVTGIFPTAGNDQGGTVLTLNGSNFETGLSVVIGGVSATVSSVTDTTIICTTAIGPVGAQTVRVTNPLGLFTDFNSFTYTTTANPTITAVSPNTGSTTGGDEITITGTNFQDGASVLFGPAGLGLSAASVTVDSPTQIRATTPTLVAGSFAIQVNNPDGTGVTNPASFTFAAPTPSGGGGGGGGGGCSSVAASTLMEPGQIVGVLLPYFLVFLLVGLYLRSSRRRPRPLPVRVETGIEQGRSKLAGRATAR